MSTITGKAQRFVDPSSGKWRDRIRETDCHKCWETITGPVFAVGVDGSCLHYHPDCRPRYADQPLRPLDILYPAGWQHPSRSCYSKLPYYQG